MWICWLGLCALFSLPSKIWKLIENKRTKNLCAEILDGIRSPPEDLLPVINRCANELHAKGNCGSWYLTKYLLCTAWSVLNPILAFWAIDYYMCGRFRLLGISIVRNDDRISDFDQAFPFKAKCNVVAYGPAGGAQDFDALCTLPINIFNRALFPFLW